MQQRKRRKKPMQNRLSTVMITMIVIIFLGVVYVQIIELSAKRDLQNIKIEELEASIMEQDKVAEGLVELGRYMLTKKFIEDVAKEKLGLVYPNEIVFKEE